MLPQPLKRRAAVPLGVAAAAGAAVAAGLWYRRYTTPFPYAHKWMLDKELPHLTRETLSEVLDPRPGERMLEIGPGTGLFSLPTARAVAPAGSLEVIDIQQEMIDHTLEAAREGDVENISGTQADAAELPFPDASFDAAFMMTVFGEIPDKDRAMGELSRVLKPGGRLVIGEFMIDWHAVPVGALRRRAKRHGLKFERRLGPRYSYLARFSKQS